MLVTSADIPFNPLDKLNLGESVARALLSRPIGPLPPQSNFEGAGIYAIYYTGNFRAYRAVRAVKDRPKTARPIYVGKAVPKGAMKGGFGLSKSVGKVLLSRIRQHARSVEQTENLKLTDFQCRYLVAEDIWIPLGESLLIEWFQPLWNVILTGFGNHTTGKRREAQYRSLWDTVHPGRPWAMRLPRNPQSATVLEQRISDFFEGKIAPSLSIEEAVTEEE